MADSKENKGNNSIFWFIIIPICVLVLLSFFVYVLFNANSIQTVSTKKVFQIIKNLKH